MSSSHIYSLLEEIIVDLNKWKLNTNNMKPSQRCCDNVNTQPQHKKKKRKKMKIYNPPYTEGYVDTHCHLDWLLKNKFECKVSDFPTVYNEYFNGNFEGAITIACWPEQYEPVTQLIYSKNEANNKIYGSFGIHPRIADQWNHHIKQQIIDLVKADRLRTRQKIVSVGECGLDYSDMKRNAPKDVQKQAFIEQIALSVDLNLPLVVHSREATVDTQAIMKKYCPKEKVVHLHCVTDTFEFAQNMLQYFPNLKVGFTGCILFKKANDKRDIVKNIALNRILLETDAPFFSSAIHPGCIPKIAQEIAKLHAIDDVNEVLKQCRLNANDIYGI